MRHDRAVVTATAAGLAALLLSTGVLAAPAVKPGYHLVKTVVLGGEGGWDYLTVDAPARRVYITRGTKVLVLDADTYAPVGEISGTEGVHGVAFAPELGRGFASAGKADEVVIFDLKTLKTLGTVKTGKNPDSILYEPSTKRVFAFDGKSGEATVIDAADGKAIGTIPVGGKPEFAATDGAGNVYVNVEDKGELLHIDAAGRMVSARWKLDGCEEPSGLAMDAADKVLFSVCRNKMMAVVDATTGKILATPPIGEHPDAAAYDPGTGFAFSSNGGGTLTVVERGADGKYSVAQTVKTRKGARTMALDSQTHRALLVTAEFGPAPKPTSEQPRPRPSIKPGTFTLLVYGR
ncbi:MAG TPA: YncE family protein [Elusimicrobiota bacterium]|jgi:YVTN family beta-propeller protein|nr:YncE family protein [Elusimicrobiota bacterium]